MLEDIYNQLGHDQAETLGLAGRSMASLAITFNEIGRLSPTIEIARVSHNLAR
jgi:hypothetical protein